MDVPLLCRWSLVLLALGVLDGHYIVVSGQEESCNSPLIDAYRSRLILDPSKSCKSMEDRRCSKYGYYHTTEYSFLNHRSQEESERQLRNFDHLIGTNCSAELEFLLCTFHFPICLPKLEDPVQPCRGLCQRVRDLCEPLMIHQGYSWPNTLDCARLPATSAVCNGRHEICVNEVGSLGGGKQPAMPARGRATRPPTLPPREEPAGGIELKPEIVPLADETEVAGRRPPALNPSQSFCEAQCKHTQVARTQPKGTKWAMIAKIKNSTRLSSGKMEYWVQVHKPLRVQSRDDAVLRHFRKGSLTQIVIKVKRKTGCPCPMLERRKRYILTGRLSARNDLRMRQGDGAVLYEGRRHRLTQILPKWLRYWMGID